MSATWWVQSRGRRRNHDYAWAPVGGADLAHLKRVREHRWGGATLDDLVDDEQPGLALVRARELGTIVYVTSLSPVPPTTDVLNRPIRAALVGVGRTSPEVTQVVAVAVSALSGTLTTLDQLSFETPDPPGFHFDARAWAAFVTESARRFARATVDGADVAELTDPAVLPDRADTRDRTAADLTALFRRGRINEIENAVLVLRSPVLDRADHERWRPWRALTDLQDAVRSPAPGPLDVPKAVLDFGVRRARRSPLGRFFVYIAPVGAITVAAAAVAWSAAQPSTPPRDPAASTVPAGSTPAPTTPATAPAPPTTPPKTPPKTQKTPRKTPPKTTPKKPTKTTRAPR